MEGRARWLGAVAAAVTALVALGTSTATASTSMAPSLRMRARALQRAHVLPRTFFDLTSVYLYTKPVQVIRNHVAYDMSLTVFADPGGGAYVDVGLSRVAGDGQAYQFHDYSFSPQSGINLRYDKRTLQTATLDTTTAITPSQITGAFTATSVKSKTCRLYDGRTGTRRTATGTFSFSAFDVVTPTAPFFGTIHTQPVKATIVKDPGCNADVIVVAAARQASAIPKLGSAIAPPPVPNRRYIRPCYLNRALGAKVGPGRFFGFEKDYRIPAIFQLAIRSGQVPPDESDFHLIQAIAGLGSLPKPVKVGPGRFTAPIRAPEGEFLGGSATFTSGAPSVRGGLSCMFHGTLRHFTRLTYRGTLEPAPSPLLAAFDTLPLALRAGTPATYVVRRYGRSR
jgi:hypothetical protein